MYVQDFSNSLITLHIILHVFSGKIETARVENKDSYWCLLSIYDIEKEFQDFQELIRNIPTDSDRRIRLAPDENGKQNIDAHINGASAIPN